MGPPILRDALTWLGLLRMRAEEAPRSDARFLMTTSPQGAGTLAGISGTIVLVGAGKMGSAMLEGWLALGLDPKTVVVIEPQPTDELSSRANRGLRLNPAPDAVGEAAAIVVAVKPQVAPEVVPTLVPYLGAGTVVVSIMAGRTLAFPGRRAVAARRGGAGDAEHAGCDRPRHHGGGAERAGVAAPARARARAAVGGR